MTISKICSSVSFLPKLLSESPNTLPTFVVLARCPVDFGIVVVVVIIDDNVVATVVTTVVGIAVVVAVVDSVI